jgi:predicted HTH transcriptional regulator
MPKILIIDDDELALKMIRANLPTEWDVMFARDGARGLEMATQHHHELSAVVLDVHLPKLDGRTVVEQLRATNPTLPIVAISGDTAALEEMKARGATTILPKPFWGEQFVEALHTLISPTDVEQHKPHQKSERLSFDRTPIPGMHVLDLDIGSIERHIRMALERRRYDGPTDWQEFLLLNGGAVEDGSMLRPTVAGALAFAQRPERWLIANGIDIAEFSGERPLSTSIRLQQPIRGDILAVIDRTVDLLWARTEHTSALDPDHYVTQVQTDAYPHIVLRELTVNALCHRDWSVDGSVIRIQILSDRIEWISPGGLPPGVTVENAVDRQVARNPALAQFLYQRGIIERFGLGLDTVVAALQEYGHPSLEMEDRGHSVTVRVYARQTLKTSTYAHHTSKGDTGGLTQRQQPLLALLGKDGGEHTTADLIKATGESKWTVIRDLQALIKQDLVISVGAARATRYRMRRKHDQNG